MVEVTINFKRVSMKAFSQGFPPVSHHRKSWKFYVLFRRKDTQSVCNENSLARGGGTFEDNIQ